MPPKFGGGFGSAPESGFSWQKQKPSQAVSSAAATNDTAGPVLSGLEPGTRVRISGLQGAAHLNGVVGILEQFDAAAGRWQVRTPDNETKAIKPENLQAEEQSETAGSGGALKERAKLLMEKQRAPEFLESFLEAATDATEQAAGDEAHSSTDPDIEGLPGRCLPWEEAPLVGWVRPDQQLYAGSPAGLPAGLLAGIGQNQEDKIEVATGDHVTVQNLKNNPQLNGLSGVVGEPLKDGRWHIVFDSDLVGDKGLKAANLKIDKKAREKGQGVAGGSAPSQRRRAPARSACPPPPSGTSLKAILKGARSDWKEKDVSLVQEKLEKVGIKTGFDLLLAVAKPVSGIDLNFQLKAAGQKAFSASTLQAFINPAVTDAKSAMTAKPVKMFPSHKFEVTGEMANIREENNFRSKALTSKSQGDIVAACLESFDGWIRLDGEPGWMIKDMQGKLGYGELLAPVGKPLLQAYDGPTTDGPQAFEVMYKHVAVRASPLKSAMMLQLKMKGEEVVATFQTYDGWVYISELDGWMLCHDAQLGQLLKHKELEEFDEDDEVLDAGTFAG